jgi:hypothetical protein
MQALPGAEYLTRLATVPQPLVLPPRQPIPANELHAHMQASASSLLLPQGIHAVVPVRATTGACHVCNRDVEFDGVRLLCCARCRITVHDTCYDETEHVPGAVWRCEPCRAGIKEQPVCSLCPVAGGAMRFCAGGQWVHAACLLWIPGACMAPGTPPDISQVRPSAPASSSLCFQTHLAVPSEDEMCWPLT